MRLTGEDLEFLARFAASPDARKLCELLRADLKDTEAKLRVSVGEEVYRQQGHAQRLDKLLADIEGASMKLVRSKPTPARELRQA
jgi:hypothetical protein